MRRQIHPILRVPTTLALVLALGTSSASAAPSPTPTPSGPYSAAKPPVSVAKARAHQFRPANTIGAKELRDGDGPALVAKEPPKVFASPPKLDIDEFSTTLHAALKDKVRGYALVVRKNGALASNVIWDRAKSPSEGNVAFAIDTRMHVASVSKLLTAMTIVDLLDEKGISVDAKIGPYLPDYWEVGQHVADITFRELMRHRSGFHSDDSDGSFPAMKREAARHVPKNASKHYANVNFSLLRVLGATLAGAVTPDTRWDAEINDAMWDIATTQWFISRVNTRLLAPAGVAAMSPIPSGASAFAYDSATDDDGWNSGDVTTQLGGVGFRLSADDVAKVMGMFRRGGAVVHNSVGRQAIEDLLGLDYAIETPAGMIRCKNGAWGQNGDVEQSIAYFMPGGIEAVLLVNSRIGSSNASINATVENAYFNSLE